MTEKQRYLFDTTGYLHLKSVLTSEILRVAQEAVNRYINTPVDQMPDGFGFTELYQNGFAFDKSLEALTMHPVTWPIIKELLADKPRFVRGSLKCDMYGNWQQVEKSVSNPGGLHCARDDYGRYSTRYETKDGRIYCDDLVAFFYFTDVFPGDGGLIVIPGSHKSEFERPRNLLTLDDTDGIDPEPHSVFTNITPRAGDVVLISELLTHGVLRWRPTERDRRLLVLRYKPQYMGKSLFSPAILDKLSAETLELISSAPYHHIKDIVKRDVVTLTI